MTDPGWLASDPIDAVAAAAIVETAAEDEIKRVGRTVATTPEECAAKVAAETVAYEHLWKAQQARRKAVAAVSRPG